MDLLQPVSNAIHQLEADQPLLSQVAMVQIALTEHAARWCAGTTVPAHLKAGVLTAFKRRFKKHYNPAWSAATVLDPAFAEQDPATKAWSMPFERIDFTKVGSPITKAVTPSACACCLAVLCFL